MQDECAQILKRAGESIEAARVLHERGLFGFSVSRAYYAMFYVAEALLLAKGLSFSKHSAVIAAFGEHFIKARLLDPRFHQHLIEAFDKRQIGDYAFQEEIEPDDAKRQMERAAVFLQAAREWLDSNASHP